MKLIYIFSIILVIINTKNLINENLLDDVCNDKQFLSNVNNVKFIGRYSIKDEITWLVQSGSAIEFYLKAKNAEVILAGDNNVIYQAKDQRPRYAIYINEKLLIDETIGELEKKIELFNSEEDMEYKINVILLSEASNGGIGIKTINAKICSSEENIIKPTEKKELSIEYIGDSITCSYGIESKSQNEPFLTTTENFSLSYAFLSAKILNADYSGVCYSGSGILADAAGNDGNLMPKFYTKTSAYGSFGDEWDFENNKNDVVLINLGTNDYNHVRGDSIKENTFIQEYVNFLTLIREKNPNSIIICTIGLMGCEYMLPLIEKAITLFGDNKVKSFLIPAQNIEDGIGAQYHPNAVSHQKASVVVAEKIQEIIEEIN
jgi:lysophospholipase L1-like esterase